LFKWSWVKDDVSSEGWKLRGGNDRSYECAGVSMYGGFNNFGVGAAIERSFNLPPHYRIKIKLTFVKIDSWDNEWAYVELDGGRIWER
jgi:hypothetical protein